MSKTVFKPVGEFLNIKIHAGEYKGGIYFLQKEITECLDEVSDGYGSYVYNSIIIEYANEQKLYAEILPERINYVYRVFVWSSKTINELLAVYKDVFARNPERFCKSKVERVLNFANYFHGELMNKANALFKPEHADLKVLSLKELCELRQRALAFT